MKSATRPALTRLLILACAIPGMTSCVGAPPIVTSSNACASLIPKGWRTPVPGADIPAGNTVGELAAFGDAQTGQLDKANDRTSASIEIVERCEDLNRQAIENASRPWWRFW